MNQAMILVIIQSENYDPPNWTLEKEIFWEHELLKKSLLWTDHILVAEYDEFVITYCALIFNLLSPIMILKKI